MTLCICEHRYALTKDPSKFYQRVDADPVAQNLRRVMWRGGDTSAEMKVYITKTVNFGDKPAGCITIAAARETAAMDEGEFREAAWFLQNRTYVDDATAGADSMERLKTLSGVLEAVAKRGGFEFKETLMSGDEEDASGDPHKVLGLIWETHSFWAEQDGYFSICCFMSLIFCIIIKVFLCMKINCLCWLRLLLQFFSFENKLKLTKYFIPE